jgi:sulfur transfer complex TusBCD TusB component (DsrH family)
MDYFDYEDDFKCKNLTMKTTSNVKTLNYEVVDLVENYSFHIKFISI